MCITPEREVDGDAFCHLSREDIATIFPSPKQFILGSKLYKLVQRARSSKESSSMDTSDVSLTGDLEETLSRSSLKPSTSTTNSSSTGSSRKRSKPELDCIPQPKKKHSDQSSSSTAEPTGTSFKLPVYSPDLQNCISNDAFYTPTQTNRLIKQSCVALRGYCWERGNPVSNSDKEALAKKIYELAPKSLGNPRSGKKSPYVSVPIYQRAILYSVFFDVVVKIIHVVTDYLPMPTCYAWENPMIMLMITSLILCRLISMVELLSGFKTTHTSTERHVDR